MTTRQQQVRTKMIEERFSEWLGEHPNAPKSRMFRAFDRIADEARNAQLMQARERRERRKMVKRY